VFGDGDLLGCSAQRLDKNLRVAIIRSDVEGENKKKPDFFCLGLLSARGILLDIETTTACWQLG
jgi:hypothetical protein